MKKIIIGVLICVLTLTITLTSASVANAQEIEVDDNTYSYICYSCSYNYIESFALEFEIINGIENEFEINSCLNVSFNLERNLVFVSLNASFFDFTLIGSDYEYEYGYSFYTPIEPNLFINADTLTDIEIDTSLEIYDNFVDCIYNITLNDIYYNEFTYDFLVSHERLLRGEYFKNTNNAVFLVDEYIYPNVVYYLSSIYNLNNKFNYYKTTFQNKCFYIDIPELFTQLETFENMFYIDKVHLVEIIENKLPNALQNYENTILNNKYTDGYNDGREVGRIEGQEIGENVNANFGEMILQFLDAPRQALVNLLNFEFLGINLGNLVFFLISAVIVFAIIKFFI